MHVLGICRWIDHDTNAWEKETRSVSTIVRGVELGHNPRSIEETIYDTIEFFQKRGLVK